MNQNIMMTDEDFFREGEIAFIDEDLSSNDMSLLLQNNNLKTIDASSHLGIKSWRFINDQLLKKHPFLRLIVAGDYDDCDLSFLEYIKGIKNLSISCKVSTKNIENISNLQNLKILNIDVSSLRDLNFLYELPTTIEEMSLGATKFKNISLKPLERFTKLKRLFIEGHTKDIETISKINSLEELTLRSITVANLDFIRELSNLWSLDIKLGGISNLSALEGLNLKYLELWQIRGLSNISFVSTLTKLQYLFLQSLRNIVEFPNISNLHHLKRIYLENMKGLDKLDNLFQSPSLEEFLHVSALNVSPEKYEPLVKIKTLKYASVGFGSDKKNKILEKVLDEHDIQPYTYKPFVFT